MTHGVRMRYLFANSLFPVVRRLYRRNTDAAAFHRFEGVGSVWTSYLQSRVLLLFCWFKVLKNDLPDVGYITPSLSSSCITSWSVHWLASVYIRLTLHT